MRLLRSSLSRSLPALAVACSLIFAAPAGSAQTRSQREGMLTKLQSFGIGGFHGYLEFLLTPAQSLVRQGSYIVVVGGTEGGMEYDYFDKARLYRIKQDGTLSFVRTLPVRARTLASRSDTIYAIAFDPDRQNPRDERGNALFSTFTHIEAFQLDEQKGHAQNSLRKKSPLRYSTFAQCLTPLADGIAVAEVPRPQHSRTDRVSILSSDASRVLATHLVTKRSEPVPDPTAPEAVNWNDLNQTVLSLAANDAVVAAQLYGGRIRLLDIRDSLRLRHEIKLKGLKAIAISNQTLYAYSADGSLHSYDVSNPDAPVNLWERRIPKVSSAKGIVIDGDRIIVHGIGLTEVSNSDAHPPRYYRVGYKWKALECVIVNGDMVYAFNGAASVSKLLVFRLVRPK